MQQAGRYRGAGKPTFAIALRARVIGRDPIPRKALWPAADMRRINRSNTWPHRPALQNYSNPPCQRRAVHTWRILLKNSALGAAAKRDSIDCARIDGGSDDGREFGIAGTVFLSF